MEIRENNTQHVIVDILVMHFELKLFNSLRILLFVFVIQKDFVAFKA